MPARPSRYQERLKTLRRQAEGGDAAAMNELYRRYHINKMMIDGKLVNLKDRFGKPSKGPQYRQARRA